jgi:HSP20 family protein
MLERLLNEQPGRPDTAVPMPINVYEEDGAVVLEACMPGVPPDDVELSCIENVLTIRGRMQVADREYLHQEMRGMEYLRRVSLPADCRFDQAEASAENGVVRVSIPKVRPRAPEKIRIQITRKGSK